MICMTRNAVMNENYESIIVNRKRMSWRDFFYFSKGERLGLIVLLCLVTTAGILLIWNNRPQSTDDAVSENTSAGGSTAVHGSGNLQSTDNQSSAAKTSAQSSSKSSSGSSSHRNTSSKKTTNSETASPFEKNADSETLDKTFPNENMSTAADTKADADADTEKESVSERVQRMTSYARPSYSRTEKFAEGTVVELNTADTTILKKVPGIGSAFARRIISYRNLLGGYYSVTQLSEVYGIDEEKYSALVGWFSADPSLVSRLHVNTLPQDTLRRHPYINYGQAKVIAQLRKQKGKLTGWENLQLLNEFTDADQMRLQPYLSFE